MNYKTMNIDDIIEYCKKNNQTDWLKAEASKINRKTGKRVTFLQIKKAFCLKFMPEIIPVAKPKAKTMYEIIEEL